MKVELVAADICCLKAHLHSQFGVTDNKPEHVYTLSWCAVSVCPLQAAGVFALHLPFLPHQSL